jgi:uncharacterized membrane-anchored protein YhcB (DUF1043 family)
MIFFIVFLIVGILIGLFVIRILTVRRNREKNEKDKIWNQQLNDLLETFKKKKK